MAILKIFFFWVCPIWLPFLYMLCNCSSNAYIHQAYSARVQTHDLLIESYLPLPQSMMFSMRQRQLWSCADNEWGMLPPSFALLIKQETISKLPSNIELAKHIKINNTQILSHFIKNVNWIINEFARLGMNTKFNINYIFSINVENKNVVKI